MPAPPPDLLPHLALALVPNLGPQRTRAVLARFGTPDAALKATADQLRGVDLIGPKLAAQFADSFRTVDSAAEWALVEKHGVRVVPAGHPDYPARLATIPDPPALLYLRGELTPADERAVAFVGSRACTPYGIRTAEKLAGGLAAAGWTVVSGLARGIDGAAHRGALDAGGRTIAVLAGGLRRIYPPEHAELAERVVRQGAILTETPMTVDPQPGMFPARNRIISGLSRAVVIVEANAKSGALITAVHAAEQGRDVYAVPGAVDSPASAGCLELIRTGARLVRSADDILEDLHGITGTAPPPAKLPPKPSKRLFDAPAPPPPPAPPAGPPPGLDGVLLRVWEALAATRHADELARELALPAGELSAVLLRLEMKRAVRRLPGNHWERR
jgi:DNA processing protein